MGILDELFVTPEFYPLKIDFSKRLVTFVRMSRSAYQSCLFVSFRGAQRFGTDLCDIRLDDVLLAAAGAGYPARRSHYILHTAYCCSTLMSRYFELIPSCFVLREPPLLAQLAFMDDLLPHRRIEAFDLSVKLLSRTFDPNQFSVIKTHVPCNAIGQQLLEHNDQSTITFLMTPLKSFVLAVLKSDMRRQRVKIWNRGIREIAVRHPGLTDLEPDQLNDAQAAAYWWSVTRFLCEDLLVGQFQSRVSLINGEKLSDFPKTTVPSVLSACGLSITEEELERVLSHPSVRMHSKHPSKPYDATLRQQEAAELEHRFDAEAMSAIDWITLRGLVPDLPAQSSPLP
jgi:hypothetical protein